MLESFKKELKEIKIIQESAHKLEVDVYRRIEKYIKEWFASKVEPFTPLVFKIDNRYVLYQTLDTQVWDLNNKILSTFKVIGLVLNEKYDNVDSAFKDFTTFNIDSKIEIVDYDEFLEKFETHKKKILSKDNYDFQWEHAAFWQFYNGAYDIYQPFFNDDLTNNFISEMMKREEKEYE